MVAYFSSKLTKQIQAALAVALLMACMMGIHWIGFSHSVSHAGFQQTSISQSCINELAPTYSHTSDICHLFDALTLAGFIPGTSAGTPSVETANLVLAGPPAFIFAQAASAAYQSRAPPTLLL